MTEDGTKDALIKGQDDDEVIAPERVTENLPSRRTDLTEKLVGMICELLW